MSKKLTINTAGGTKVAEDERQDYTILPAYEELFAGAFVYIKIVKALCFV